MFEAKLTEGHILKKIIEAIKDLVTDVNIDVSPSGLSLQAMDTSHVALVSLNLAWKDLNHTDAIVMLFLVLTLLTFQRFLNWLIHLILLLFKLIKIQVLLRLLLKC